MKIGIVMPVINQYEKAIKALASIKTFHSWQPYIQPQWDNPKPLAAAWNRGVEEAINDGCEYILITNDDVLFSPFILDNMVASIIKNKVIMVTGINDRGKYYIPEQITVIEPMKNMNDESVSDNPDFACMMITKDFFDLVGKFDEHFIPAYYEDNECHYRIILQGYRAIATTAAPYYHYGSQSQNHALGNNKPLVSGEAFDKNGRYLQAKWGTRDAHQKGYDYPFNNPKYNPKEWHPEWRAMVLGNES